MRLRNHRRSRRGRASRSPSATPRMTVTSPKRGDESWQVAVDRLLAFPARPRPIPARPMRQTITPRVTWWPVSAGRDATITRIPANPMTMLLPRIAVNRSSSSRRANSAAKNGALFNSTAAMAGPASRVPSEIRTSVRVTFPAPITPAQAHPHRVRGQAGADQPQHRQHHQPADKRAR
jgi:hypothetical protein